jgi:molecular chaperone GrpE
VTRKRHDMGQPADGGGPAGPGPGNGGPDDAVLDETLLADAMVGEDDLSADAPPATAGGASSAAEASDVEAAVVEAFEAELAAALRRADEEKARADESWDLYLRSEAELENQRRRAERLRDEAQARVRRELLARILEVNDNLERALAHRDADPALVIAGVEATYRELARLLSRAGVAVVEALDAPFDPAVHEAVGVVPVPGLTEERVISVERPGYTLNGELLRPARVMVGQPA